jgi:hypothetical protein
MLRIRPASAALLLALAAGIGVALHSAAAPSSTAAPTFEVTAQSVLLPTTPETPPTDDMYWDPKPLWN